MKKSRSLLAMLMVIMLAIALAACSSEDSSGSGDSNSGGSSGSSSDSGSEAKEEPKEEPKEQAGFVPAKNIEFVVPYSAGGGSDTNARFLTNLLKENGIVEQNFQVVNKTGGSGAVGNTHTYNKAGDGSTIMTWVSGQMTSALVNKADVNLEDLTPLGVLALDSFLLVVDNDSPYQTAEEFIEAAKANPGEIAIGGAGKGNEDHLVTSLFEKHTEGKLKYVTFQGGGETISALLGGHIDAIFTNPNEILAQIEAGEVRALATSSKERLSGALADVPTFTELGYPGVYFEQFRGYVGPPDMPAEAVAYWENVLKQASEHPDWQNNYIAANDLTPSYMNAAEAKAFFEESFEMYKEILREVGMIE